MMIVDDIQDALDLYETDDTQWLVTDGTQYGVCAMRRTPCMPCRCVAGS